MNAAVKILITTGLCAASAWAVRSHAPVAKNEPATPSSVTSQSSVSTGNSGNLTSDTAPGDSDPGLAMRRAIARCETTALWTWLKDNPSAPPERLYTVATELFDRQGSVAMDVALALEDKGRRRAISELFLGILSARDPWSALDLFKAHRDEFGGKGAEAWGANAMCEVVKAGCGISGGKLVDLMKQLSDLDSGWTFRAEFPDGFDFKVALDYRTDRSDHPLGMPDNLAEEWARRSPADAAGWLAQHPGAGFQDKEDQDIAMGRVFTAVATSNDSSRDSALMALSGMSEEIRTAAWIRVADQSAGKIDPAVMSAASRMGDLSSYLVPSLLQTRQTEMMDPSWSAVPAADRSELIEAALAKWSSNELTPLDREVREHWRATIEKQWAALAH